MLPVNTSVQDVMSAIGRPGGDHILVKMNSMGGGTQILKTYHIIVFGIADIFLSNSGFLHSVSHPAWVVLIHFLLLFLSSLCWKSVFDILNTRRKSSVKAGCYCSLHRLGTQRKTVRLREQPSGTSGEESMPCPLCSKHVPCPLRKTSNAQSKTFSLLILFLSPSLSISDAPEGAAGSRARNNWRPRTDGLERHRQWTHKLWLGAVHCHAWGNSANMTNFTSDHNI